MQSVEVQISSTFPDIIRYPEPTNGDEAKFSLPHSVAAALLREKNFLFDAFTDEKVKDPRFKEQWGKVKAIVRPEFGTGIMEGNNPITIKLKDGAEYKKVCNTAHGDAADPLTNDEVVQRYMQCVQGILADEDAARSAKLTLALDRLHNISELMRILTFPSTR